MPRPIRSAKELVLALLGLTLFGALVATVRTPELPARPAAGWGGEREEEAREERGPAGFVGKKPNDWFYLQRAYPGTEIPMARYLDALEQTQAVRASSETGERGAVVWQPAGPTNIMGRITCVAVHPSVPGRIFLGAAAGGVFRSTNDGVSWQPVTDGYGVASMGDLAIDPQDPNMVYAGTGEPNASGDSYDGIGVLRSTDGGTSWDLLTLRGSRHIGRIVVDPTNSGRIWAAATGTLFSKSLERGIYRSDDSARTWVRKLFISDSTAAIDVALDPSNTSTVYAAMWERIRHPDYRKVGGYTSGIWKSTDAGETWTRLGNGLPASGPTVGRIGLAVAQSQPSTVYAAYADDPGNFAGVYKSTNSGANWSRVNDGSLSGMYGGFGWYFGQIRVDPTNPNKIFVLGVSLYRSTNGGSGWSDVSGSMHVDHHALWIDPSNTNRIFEGNDGGLYRSTNGGSVWSAFNGLPITQFYAIAIDNLLPQRLYGGTQDNGTLRTQTGNLNDWQMIYGGDGFYCLVDPTNSNVIYAEYQYGGLGKSTNGGASFYDATNGINSGDRRNWSTPVVMDPTNNQVLYYGTYRVYRTTNGAANWSSISGDLTGGPGGGNLVFPTVTTIAVAPSNTSTVYAGTDDAHVWVTTNTGSVWTNISAGLPNRWVTRVAVDPANRDIAYVTVSGYKWDEPQPHVFRTTNRGLSWTDISGDLPDGPVNAIVVDPNDTNVLYVGTDFDVFVTRNLGARWDLAAAGFPLNPVQDLVLHNATRSLVAGTHGRSMYRLSLPNAAGVEEAVGTAGRSSLALAGANPFRQSAELSLSLPCAADLRVRVVDLGGRTIREIASGRYAAGLHPLVWDGRDGAGRSVAPGVYFARLEAVGRSQVVRLVRVQP